MKVQKLKQIQAKALFEIIDLCRKTLSLEAELNWTSKSLEEALKGGGQVFGSIEKGKLVGFILYSELSTEHLEILCLATHPEYLRMGIMSDLLNQLQKQAQEIWLEVHEQNKGAIEFYKSKGFQQVGLRKFYYKDGKSALLLSWK